MAALAGGAALRLDRVCRGCLKEAPDMTPLFAPQDPPLDRMMMASTQLQMSVNDDLPYQICHNCIEQLSAAFSFKQMCLQSDEIAKRQILNIKTEKGAEEFLHSNGDNIAENQTESQNLRNSIDDKICIRSEKDLRISNMSNVKCVQTKSIDNFHVVHNCILCTKNFSTVSGLTRHLKCEHGVENFHSCKECEIIFDSHKHYKNHMLNIHGKNVPDATSGVPILECQTCTETFGELNQLKQHNFTVHGKKKVFECGKCHRGFNKPESFDKHKIACGTKHIGDFDLLSDLKILNSKFENIFFDKRDSTEEDTKNNLKNLQSNKISNSRSPLISNNINIKEEPLDEFLAEADGNTQMLIGNNCNSAKFYDRDDDYLSFDDRSDIDGSDSSEYLESLKTKRKNGKTYKKNKNKKLKLNNENDSVLKYQCSTCPKMFPTSLEMKIHDVKQHKESMYMCEVCDESFSDSSQLEHHECVQNASEKLFKCSSCDKAFNTEENLAVHMCQHIGNKPHKCEKCDKGFLRLEHLKRHYQAMHSGKLKNPKVAFCPICNKGFTTEKYLETHMRMHTGDKTFTCKVCNKSFNTKWHLKEHSKWHSTEKQFLCSECGQSFIRNDYLITHMRRHNGEKPYKCIYCNKGFPRSTDLTVHLRYHTGEKPHLCTICGKGFQRQYNLTVHLRVHTGEKPYICTYCGKCFAQGNDLKSHIRRHTGERYNCEICGEGFIQGYHLTQHKKNIHGLECVSHIRRVEKHIQPAPQNRSNVKSQSPQPEQTNSTTNNESQPATQVGVVEIEVPPQRAVMPLMPLALFTPMHPRI